LLPQRSKHPREMVVTPKASTSIEVINGTRTAVKRFVEQSLLTSIEIGPRPYPMCT